MKSFNKYAAVAICALLGACSNEPQYVDVFPQLSHLDRVWQDEDGVVYSAIQDVDGDFTVHDTATGMMYNYRLRDGNMSSRPSDAPFLEFADGVLTMGTKNLQPMEVTVEEITFTSNGTEFYGVLSIPKSDRPVPIIVDAHGSGRAAATGFYWSAAWYNPIGFASLVFDKRGTGKSGGEYTHDFEVLAEDLDAAVEAVSHRADIDENLIGAAGYSQGVWVATLAASTNPDIAFLIASYGMTESPLTEDAQITKLLFESNYPSESWEKFEPLVNACGEAFALRNEDRWSEVISGKQAWKGRIDASDLEGTLVGDGCLAWPPFILKLVGRSQFPPGLKWGYDPKPVMAELDIPVIWQFAEADRTAPSASSIVQVSAWSRQGKPFSLHSYAGADHGMYMTATTEHGETYRYKSPQYLSDLRIWLTSLRQGHNLDQGGAQ